MQYMQKKIFSILFSLLLIFSSVPIGYAQNETAVQEPVAKPVPAKPDLNSYLASLTLSDTEKAIADTVINYVSDCVNRISGTDYKSIQFECSKDSYYIKVELDKLKGTDDSNWKEVIDYIMIKSTGEANYWMDGDAINVNNWKEVVKERLNLNLGRDDNTGELWSGSLWINWEKFGLSKEDRKKADEGNNIYWEWENEQRSNKLKATLTASVSSESQSSADEVIAMLKEVAEKITTMETSPSGDVAYQIAYKARLLEGKVRGIGDTLSVDSAGEFCNYVKLNGPGKLDVWQNEYGEAQTGSLRIKSTVLKGLETSFDCNYDDYQDKYWMSFWLNWDRDTSKTYSAEIKKAQKEAESEARKLEVAGKLKEFLDKFTISDDNEETAKELTKEIDALITKTETFVASEQSVYEFQYDTSLLRAKIDGIGQSLSCDDFLQIKEYIVLYSKGTAQVWQDQYGDNVLGGYKELYNGDTVTINFNSWGCDDYSDTGGMSVDLSWGKDVSKNYKKAIKKAEEDSWKEAEALRRAGLVIEARKLYSFSLEVQEAGDSIIEMLVAFKDRVKAFESNPTAEGAYQVQYNNIILTSELDGMAQVYGDLAEDIGNYVVLYGPGTPDIWKQWDTAELEIGSNLRVYSSTEIEFNFNKWFDEFQDRGGFGAWMNWGKLRKAYSDELKRAERDAWQEADRQRKFRMAEKLRSDLEPEVGEGIASISSNIREYVILVRKYLKGDADVAAYDVELKRLQVSDLMSDVTEIEKDYLLVSDLGTDVNPPEVWYDFENEEIIVGGWRELVTKNVTKKKQTFPVGVAGMNGWCNDWVYGDGICKVELNMNWEDWRAVEDEISRANELFFRQKREAELTDVLAGIVNNKISYSSADQGIETELVAKFAEVEELGAQFSSLGAGELQYKVLIARDDINDKLDEAEDQSIIEIAVAEAEGYHDYDYWFDELRGVVLYSDSDIEIVARFSREFAPFFVEEKDVPLGEYGVQLEIIWKKWSRELRSELRDAFERYDKEQSVVRLNKLIEKRDQIIEDITGDALQAKVQEYENGQIRMGEVRRYVEAKYFKLKAYDAEVAYLAALGGQAYPEFTPIDIKVDTEHVRLSFIEKPFNYKFGGGIGLQQLKFGKQEEFRGAEFAPDEVEATRSVKAFREDIQIDAEGNIMQGAVQQSVSEPAEEITGKAIQEGDVNVNIEGNVEGDVTINIYHEDIALEIEEARKEIREEKEKAVEDIYAARQDVFSDRTQVRRFGGSREDEAPEERAKRLRINGIKPRMKLRIDVTDAEIKAIAENVKAKFIAAQEKGVIDDIIYDMNLQLDNVPSLSDALAEWGDTTTSFRLTYKNESIFEFSFKVEDGYFAWARYGVGSDAGANDSNIYIGLQLESIIKLRNWWEERVKEASGPGDVIVLVPTFVKNVGGMVMSGEIEIKPFGAVFKIPKFLQVMFSGLGQSAGFDEI